MKSQTENITHIVFDFDYTLTDSSQGVFSCINYALGELGYPETTYQTACQTIGLSLRETYAALTGEPSTGVDEFVRLFIQQAEEVMADATVLFDETPETIISHYGVYP